MNKYFYLLLGTILAILLATVLFITHKPKLITDEVPSAIVLRVGTNSEYPPFSFKDGSELKGFDIDLIYEVANRMEATIAMTDMPFDALIPALQLGSIDVIAAGLTRTDERANRMFFTKPYITGDPLLIISSSNNPLTTLAQLTGKPVVVNEGYTADAYMSGIQGPELIRLATPAEAILALQSGRARAFVCAQSAIDAFLKKDTAQQIVATAIPDSGDTYALAISKYKPELAQRIESILDDMHADGTIKELKTKWNFK